MKKCYLLCCLIFGVRLLSAQGLFPAEGIVFDDHILPRVDVLIDTDSLAAIYDSANAYNYHEYPATFIFTSGSTIDTILNIGFRIRGNTSRQSFKKSFKISFNTFKTGRKYHGLQKMNLNGEHNDPSLIRSKLCWDLYRKMGVPAPRANHIQVYINGNFMGLYINVEHVDDRFVKKRFGNDNGNLFKCTWPSDLVYISNNPDDYKNNGHYDLKTNLLANDYSDLAHFIDVLNNTPLNDLPCALEPVFNVDVCLRALAVDVFTGNWDGYAFNKNNFYLYHNTQSGRFEYIPYDLDNTLGIDWLGIDWANRNIYQWSPATEPRPLYDRLLSVPAWKERFSFYLDSLVNGIVDTNQYFLHIDSIYNRIYASAAADPYRPLDYGFSINDFSNSYTQALWGHVTYGLKPYINARIQSANQQLQINPFQPAFLWASHQHPGAGTLFPLQCKLAKGKGSNTLVWAFWDEGMGLDSVLMHDDGLSGDAQANDGIYSVIVNLIPGYSNISYFFTAFNGQGGTQYPCNTTFEIQRAPLPELAINEILPYNQSVWEDQAGETDDWIELFNYGAQLLHGQEFYLTDNPAKPGKWQLPNLNINPSSYPFIWADKQSSQGIWHAGFSLKAAGEFIGLYWKLGDDYIPLDTFTFAQQTSDISEGRLPDGTGVWQTLSGITPAYSNALLGLEDPSTDMLAKIFPNPFSNHFTIYWPDMTGPAEISVLDIQGRILLHEYFRGNTHQFTIHTGQLPAGIYLARIKVLNSVVSPQIIKLIKP